MNAPITPEHARVKELTEERDWLARQYQKLTGCAYIPGKCRWEAEGGTLPSNSYTTQELQQAIINLQLLLGIAEAKVAEQEAAISEHKSTYDTNLATLAHNYRIEIDQLRDELRTQADTIERLKEELIDIAGVNREQAISLAIFTELLQDALSVRFVDHVWCLRTESALNNQESKP